MKRDAQATKQRILDAATAEFSQYGLAGARVDRIAAASGSNKGMIYAYFGNKEGLFNAMGAFLIAWHLNEVPLDTADLPGYAARVFNRYQQHPELMRLVNWERLERGGAGLQVPQMAETVQAKIEAIQQAQAAGLISDHFPAPILFELMLALIELRLYTGDTDNQQTCAERESAVRDAVALLVEVKPVALPVRKHKQK